MDDVFRHTESGTGHPQLNVKVTGGISVNLHFIKRKFGCLWGVAVHRKHFQDLTSRTTFHIKNLL